MNFRAPLLFFLSLFFSSIYCMEEKVDSLNKDTSCEDPTEGYQKNKKEDSDQTAEEETLVSNKNFLSYKREKHNPIVFAFVAGGLCVYLYNKLFPCYKIITTDKVIFKDKIVSAGNTIFKIIKDGVIELGESGSILGDILEKFVDIKIILSGSGTININFPETAKINIYNPTLSGSGFIYLNGKKIQTY